MAEPESKPKYAVNPETGQVMRNDGTGWQKVKTAKNEAGDILINEGGQWAPLPGRASPPAPAGFVSPPKIPVSKAMMIAGRQGREWGTSDEAAGVRKAMGVPDWAARAYEMVNPMAPFVNMGMGIGGMVGEATGNAPSGYTQGRDEARAELAQARSDRPVTSFVSELAGGAAYPAGALKMGAPILGQTVKMAAIGGAQGAAYGYAASEGDTEDRLTTGAIGGVLGAGLGGAMPSLAAAIVPYFRAGKGGVSQFSDWLAGKVGLPVGAVDKHNEEVVRAAILRSAERSKMTPEKILSEIERLGDKPAVLAEVIGQDAVNALSAITRRPGSSPQKAQAIIEDRFGGFVDRAQTDLEQATGFQRGAFAQGVDSPAVAEEIAARQAAAKPVYAEAFGQFPTVVSERLTQLSQSSPVLQSAMAKAQKALANEAASAGRAVDEMPELQFWDLVKRELDQAETAALAKPGGAEAARQIEIIRKPLVDELDAITGGIYARARELGGEAPRLRSAFTSGQRALGAKPAGAIEAEVGAMNPQDQPWFRAGMTGDISTRIDQGRLPPTRFRVPDVQKKVRAGFGDEAGNAFIRNMEAEASLRETGARWAPRMQSITGTVLESGPEDFAADGLSALGRLMSGDKLGFLRDISGFMRRRGYNQAQIDAMGDLLLSNPQEGLRRLGIQLPQGGPPSGGGAAGGAVGAGFGPSSQMPENAFAQTMSNQQTVPSQNAFAQAAPKSAPVPDNKQNMRAQMMHPQDIVKQNADGTAVFKPGSEGERMAQQTVPSQNAFRSNEAGSASPEVVMGMFSGTGGSMAGAAGGGYYGANNDLNGDGVIDEKDVERGALMGGVAGFGVGVSPFAARELMQRGRPAAPEFANDALPMRRNLITAPDNMEDVQDYMTLLRGNDDFAEVAKILGLNFDPGAIGGRGKEGERIRSIIDRERSEALSTLYKKYHEIKRASRPAIPEQIDEFDAEAPAPPSADILPFRPNDTKPQGLGNALAQSALGSAGGSALGSREDLNRDGVIDEQDVMIGAAGGTVGLPGVMALMRRGGNAFAPDARSMGAGGGRKPPQPPRDILPEGSLLANPFVQGGVGYGLGQVAPIPSTGDEEQDAKNRMTLSLALAGGFAAGRPIRNALRPKPAKPPTLTAAESARAAKENLAKMTPDERQTMFDEKSARIAKVSKINAAGDTVSEAKRYESGIKELLASYPDYWDDIAMVYPDRPSLRSITELMQEVDPGRYEMFMQGRLERAGDPNEVFSRLEGVLERQADLLNQQKIRPNGFGAGGGRPPRKPPPDSPEAITDAVRGIAKQAPPTPPGGPVIPPRGNMRGVLQAPERIPPASPMADQVPPPLPPRPVSNRVPTSNMPNATEMGLIAGTGAAVGGAFLMEKANDPATFGLASFDELPPEHPLRDPQFRQMALMAQMKQAPKAPPPVVPQGVPPTPPQPLEMR